MSAESRHSLLVQWAKVALPLAALALLSTLFLFSGKPDPTTASIYARVDVQALVAEPRLTAPEYSGMTEDGAALSMRAQTATPDPQGNGAKMSAILAKLESADGLVTDLTAGAGQMDPAAGRIVLSQKVAVQTSRGYRIVTEQIDMATDHSRLTAPEPVQAEAPYGTITAGRMQIDRADPASPYDLVFNDGVKLIYQPKK